MFNFICSAFNFIVLIVDKQIKEKGALEIYSFPLRFGEKLRAFASVPYTPPKFLHLNSRRSVIK